MTHTAQFPIIPKPVSIQPESGRFVFSPKTLITASEAHQQNAAYLRALLSPPTGFALPVCPEADYSGAVHLRTGSSDRLGQEGYCLTITEQKVVIEAAHPAGSFYAVQTLRQLLPPEVEQRDLVSGMVWALPACTVTDSPRFPWRGFMLDEGRHFQGKQTVLDILDLMALHKLNVFHWHLTEDQGWRIQINRYPLLTEIGSKRKGTTPGFYGMHDGIPHQGFYTQAEIREIVAYAAQRRITVVPEIEFPGHSLAALAAYPQLSCTGGPFEVSTHFGILPDLYCAGNEEVFTFLECVLDEILDLFPSPYIHIGGDEAPKKRWKQCPKCQARMRAEGLKDENELQVYFTNRIAACLNQSGRRIAGWNQILGQGLDTSVVPQYWVGGRKKFIQAVQDGHQAVMSSYLSAYLDHAHSLTPLSKAYAYEPVMPELEPNAERILGVEALLWSEFVRSRARLDYQTFPRLTALAETAWTQREQKNWPDFRARLNTFLPRLKQLSVRYAPLKEAEPPKLKQIFGIFTIPQAQTKTAK
jgi:hexosaminidase